MPEYIELKDDDIILPTDEYEWSGEPGKWSTFANHSNDTYSGKSKALSGASNRIRRIKPSDEQIHANVSNLIDELKGYL